MFEFPEYPPELTVAEAEQFGLMSDCGTAGRLMCKPSFIETDEVWAAALKKDTPWYALYSAGTNNLVVLRYAGKWEKIKLDDIKNLYGLIWKMCVGVGIKN